MKNSTLSQLLGNSANTITNWRNEERPIIALLEKYFTDLEIQEFLETGKISKLENDAIHISQTAQKSIGIVQNKGIGILEKGDSSQSLKFVETYTKLEQIAGWGKNEGINDLKSKLELIKQELVSKYA